jgi:hypothetical protein
MPETIQERLKDAFRWAVAGNYCGLKQQDVMLDAIKRIDKLEDLLRKIDMVYFNPTNDPITVEKRKLLSKWIQEAL